MKVAIVVNTLKIGGMERVAINLSDAYQKSGHDTHLIYLRDKKIVLRPNDKTIPVHLFNLKKIVLSSGIGFFWLILSKISNIIFRKSFSIIFAYAEAIAFRYELNKLEKKQGKFDLVIFRGQGTFEHIWPIKDSRFVFVCENVQELNRYKGLSKWAFNNLFHQRNVSCVSNGALNSLEQLCDEYDIVTKKMIMINNPNNLTLIKNKSVSKPLHNKPFILGLGRLVPQKNFSLLIEAYKYSREHLGVTQDLVIVGEGEERDALEKLVERLDLTDTVHFKGLQTNPFPWYEQAELFVLSSKFEGLGMVLIEALACGTMVVCTDSKGGVRQIMQGKLEPFLAKESPKELAQTIKSAMNHSWNKDFDLFVNNTLYRFDDENIAKEFLSNFTE
ncbi:glycosyltransferase [Vibrio coralliirubri]|uniref:glycosyltransferase n=1 Tax=Vibrio coralliirubri TaxID=1516159 RepID=UPI000A36E811|nr:glycosyltransferase [Vibrio coralliirubri]